MKYQDQNTEVCDSLSAPMKGITGVGAISY